MSYTRFNTNGRVPRRTNRLYKIGNVKVLAPSKEEAKRRLAIYTKGVQEIASKKPGHWHNKECWETKWK